MEEMTITITKLKKKLDAIFSKYKRLSEADENGMVICITCGKRLHYKEAHNGHFVPRQILATRFSEINTNVQCCGCNTYKDGEQYLHGKAIDFEYGEGTADWLMSQPKDGFKIDKSDYEAMIDYYSYAVKYLLQTKGLE